VLVQVRLELAVALVPDLHRQHPRQALLEIVHAPLQPLTARTPRDTELVAHALSIGTNQ
jgi:hypothetical protein